MSSKAYFYKIIGPGIIVAATGIGAGDLIAVAVSGAKYGYVLLWAVVLGAVLKYVLNEGISRYQLISGQSVLKGCRSFSPLKTSQKPPNQTKHSHTLPDHSHQIV